MISSGHFILKGRRVCREAFAKIHDFAMSTFYNYKRGFEDGWKVGFHGNKGLYKTRSNTLVARAHLETILKASGEPMPHLAWGGENGNDSIQYRLPSCESMKDIFREIALNMEIDGLTKVTNAIMYKIWETKYANYGFHKSSAFAKCTQCTQFKDGLSKERRKKERAILEEGRANHLREQMSRRYVYYAHRVLAKKDPDNYLCIIHDKMDQNKTWIPRLVTVPKSLTANGMALPIALTGMLTHGREPGVYAHFSLSSIRPGDFDFTITSIAKCLRDLETYSGDKSGDIIEQPTGTSLRPLFQSLLNYDVFLKTYLEPRKENLEKFCGNLVEKEESQIPSTATNEGSGG
jgi:hypothetical protein